MKKIAIVIQRFDFDIVGGAEGYALNLAKILSEEHNVDIITSTSLEHTTWKNELKEGIEIHNNMKIIRFDSDFEKINTLITQGDIYPNLFHQLFDGYTNSPFQNFKKSIKEHIINRIKKLPYGIFNDFIKYQGPFSQKLLKYIENKEDEYDTFIFMTYLYSPTYFGIDRVKDKSKVFIIPTFHDELFLYFPSMQKYRNLKHLFLSNKEKELCQAKLYNPSYSKVIGFGMQDKYQTYNINQESEKFILYAGRLEESKGVLELFEYFKKYIIKYKNIKLYLIGDGALKDIQHPFIEYKGFVDEQEKLELAFESLGIVLLESFMMKTPAIVNAKSDVLK